MSRTTFVRDRFSTGSPCGNICRVTAAATPRSNFLSMLMQVATLTAGGRPTLRAGTQRTATATGPRRSACAAARPSGSRHPPNGLDGSSAQGKFRSAPPCSFVSPEASVIAEVSFISMRLSLQRQADFRSPSRPVLRRHLSSSSTCRNDFHRSLCMRFFTSGGKPVSGSIQGMRRRGEAKKFGVRSGRLIAR
jgi:hypothetical protein